MTRMPAVSTMHAVPKGTPLALAINGGSSSIKFALYNVSGELTRGLHGKIDRIGQPDATIVFQESECEQQESRTIGGLDHSQAATFLIRWLSERIDFASVTAVGHRVVTGGAQYSPFAPPNCLPSSMRGSQSTRATFDSTEMICPKFETGRGLADAMFLQE